MRILLSKEPQKVKSFEIRYKRMSLLYKKLEILGQTYLVDISTGSTEQILGRFRKFFYEGVVDDNASSRKKNDAVIWMGGEPVIDVVRNLLDEIELIELHRDPKAKELYIKENLYTYIEEPQAVKLYNKLRTVSDELGSLHMQEDSIRRVLSQYSWEPATKTVSSVTTFKRMIGKTGNKKKKSPQLEDMFINTLA